MIVVITSCAPVVARRNPAIPAQTAPASAAQKSARGTWMPRGTPVSSEPTATATITPTRYWPWPPMLKRPQRKAKATASAVRISVDVRISVCWRLIAEIATASASVG